MSSKDDKPSPHIRVVAENSKSDIDRERAKRDIERPLLRLAANIMRVSRGAGDPWEIPVQCADVIKSFHAYHDATGEWPHGKDTKAILSFRDPDLHQYRYRELEDAMKLWSAAPFGWRQVNYSGRSFRPTTVRTSCFGE